MINFWDERYSQEEFVYGTEPNEFLKETLTEIKPGKILFPAEGEGRNSAFAAQLGWDVFAFDSSRIAKEKATKLYKSNNINVNYSLCSLENYECQSNFFDCIALIFVHPSEDIRKKVHLKLLNYIKPNGILILEAFSKDHLKYSSGGPKNKEMLFSEEIIKNDFGSLNIKLLSSIEKFIYEGEHHKGKAAIIDFIAQKP